MTLLNGQGQIILDKTGKSELSSYLPSELPVPKDWAKEAPSESVARLCLLGAGTLKGVEDLNQSRALAQMIEQAALDARRNQSIKRLRERQVHAAYWLPLLWEKAEEPGRTTEEVCARAPFNRVMPSPKVSTPSSFSVILRIGASTCFSFSCVSLVLALSVGEENNIILTQEDKEILLLACCPGDEGENGSYAKENFLHMI